MKRKLCLAGLFILLSASACGGTETRSRIPLAYAEDLVRAMIYAQVPDMNPAAQFPLEEITTDEIWQRLGVQVFKVIEGSPYQYFTYLIKDKKVVSLGTGFGGFGVTSMQVTDLNDDNEPELVYAYSWGSGLHRSLIGAYCNQWPNGYTINSNFAYLYEDISLDKTSDHAVSIKAGYFDVSQNFITEATLGKLVLSSDNGTSHLEVRLNNDLPAKVRERVTVFSP